MNRICTMVLLGLLAATTLSAQEAPDSEHIERVTIRGNRRIPARTIKSWIASRKGDYYRAEQLDRAIKALFDTGHFFDVKVYVEDGLQRGKIVTFEVLERPLIHEVGFEGIDLATQADIREEWRKQKIDLSQGSEYDPVKVRRATAVIQDLLVSRGNQRAKVTPMAEQETSTAVSIVFKIEE